MVEPGHRVLDVRQVGRVHPGAMGRVGIAPLCRKPLIAKKAARCGSSDPNLNRVAKAAIALPFAASVLAVLSLGAVVAIQANFGRGGEWLGAVFAAGSVGFAALYPIGVLFWLMSLVFPTGRRGDYFCLGAVSTVAGFLVLKFLGVPLVGALFVP